MADCSESEFYMNADQWAEHWEKEGSKSFHLPKVCGLIKKYENGLVNGKQNSKVLFPFCGKAFDMKWLADQGHTVVGCDCAPLAFQEFFKEHNVEYTTEKLDDFTVYRSLDKKLIMYCGDFYNFTSKYEGQFDGMWDRGALNAVNVRDQTRYRDLIISLMKPDCQCYVTTYDCEDQKTRDEWAMLTDEKLMDLFGEKCDLQLRVEYVPAKLYNEELVTEEEEHFLDKLTIITLKK